MTRANNRLVGALIAGLAVLGQAQERTSEITSNDLWRLAGSGDTLWVATSKGLNFTTDVKSDTLRWQGFADMQVWALACGGGTALACLAGSEAHSNGLWLYRHGTDAVMPINPRFDTEAYLRLGASDSIQPYFLAGDAVWHAGAYWIAYGDGGLGRLDPASSGLTLFYPGDSHVALRADEFTPASFDTAKSAVSVAVDDSSYVWLGCHRSLWRFNPADSSWLAVSDSLSPALGYLDVAVSGGGSAASLYAIALVKGATSGTIDTTVVKYQPEDGRIRTFIPPRSRLSTVATGPHRRVYVLCNDQVNLYRDTLPSTSLPYAVAAISGETFQLKRFPTGIDYPTVNDILPVTSGQDSLFFIATSIGLFYSLDAYRDETENVRLRRVYREKTLQAGLKEVYAYPSILNDSYTGQKAVFAYNLAEDDHVTIDIFDFNMDPVIRIIDGEPRLAGKNRPDGSGRSTNITRDCWDGTFNNRGGKPVAAGVYYFRVKTKNGKSGFGKVIVAKSYQ